MRVRFFGSFDVCCNEPFGVIRFDLPRKMVKLTLVPGISKENDILAIEMHCSHHRSLAEEVLDQQSN